MVLLGLFLLVVGVLALLIMRDETREALPARLRPLLPASRAAREGRHDRLSVPALIQLLERIARAPAYRQLTALLTRCGRAVHERIARSGVPRRLAALTGRSATGRSDSGDAAPGGAAPGRPAPGGAASGRSDSGGAAQPADPPHPGRPRPAPRASRQVWTGRAAVARRGRTTGRTARGRASVRRPEADDSGPAA